MDETIETTELKVTEEFIVTDTEESTEETTEETTVSASGVDYDLTVMGRDMVYATVSQMMIDPDTYIGKTFKVSGQFYSTWYEPTQKRYFCVLIMDSTSCCSQELEFVWDDGSHVYPDEYPADGTTVEVIGIYENYEEEGGFIYSHLNNASMTVVQ